MATVYVNWYGQTLQGEVVENRRTDSLADMVAVRIPLMGCHPVALFTPQHVYMSPEQIAGYSSKVYEEPSKVYKKLSKVSSTVRNPSAAWQRIQAFKASHWDEARGHLKVDALDEFYKMWRDAVAEKRGVKVEPVTHICVQETQPIISDTSQMVPDEAAPLQQQLPPITYHKPKKPIVATQLSLFD